MIHSTSSKATVAIATAKHTSYLIKSERNPPVNQLYTLLHFNIHSISTRFISLQIFNMFSPFLPTITVFTFLVASVHTAPLSEALSKRVEPTSICESGRVYYAKGQCPSGFVGCAPPNSALICDGKEMHFSTDCGHPAFNLGRWFECPNEGFLGCNTIESICETAGKDYPSSTAAPTPTPTNTSTKTSTTSTLPDVTGIPVDPHQTTGFKCPQGTKYFPEGMCPSGFIGCHKNGGEVCQGGKRFWPGECPAGTGIWTRCWNGFKGCTTNVNICG